MEPKHIVRWSSDCALEQVADPMLQDLVGRQADRIFDPLGFQELVNLRHGERCVSAEIDTRELAFVACNDRLEHAVPAVGAVHVAGTQGAAFEITELVEHEQWMIAGAGVMPVPDAHLLLAMGRLTLESMSSTMLLGGRRPCTRSIHWPDKSAIAERFSGAASL